MSTNSHNMLAVIPARGGSKGVPGKNLRPLAGVPLALISINYALSEKLIDEIIFSTDDSALASLVMPIEDFLSMEIGTLRRLKNRLSIHRRSVNLANDESKISETLFEISKMQVSQNYEFLLMLQPTSPFRNVGEIDNIIKLTERREWTSIVSIRNATNTHPERMYTKNESYLNRFMESNLGDNPPRQLLDPVYIKDGAFYLLKSSLLKNDVMLGNQILHYDRSEMINVNIDTELDFQFADFIFRTERG